MDLSSILPLIDAGATGLLTFVIIALLRQNAKKDETIVGQNHTIAEMNTKLLSALGLTETVITATETQAAQDGEK